MASLVRGLAAALLVTAIISACSNAVPSSALKVGDCVNHTNTTDADGNAIDSTVVVACSQAHEEEVFSVFDYPNATSTFPGYEAIGAIEQTQCESDFAGYVGVTWDQSDAYTINYAGPTEHDWAAGDRAIVCTLDDANGGKLTGPARGTAR